MQRPPIGLASHEGASPCSGSEGVEDQISNLEFDLRHAARWERMPMARMYMCGSGYTMSEAAKTSTVALATLWPGGIR